jgi:hypothetical protein
MSIIQWTTDDETRPEFTSGTHIGKLISVMSEPPKKPNDDRGQPNPNNLVWRVVGKDSITNDTCYVTAWNPLRPKSGGMKKNGEWLRALGIDPAKGITFTDTDQPGISEIKELANLDIQFTIELETKDGETRARLKNITVA